MGFNYSIETILIVLAVVGAIFLFMGFNWIKLLALITGFLIGYYVTNAFLDMEGVWLTVLSIVAGLILAYFMFNFHLVLVFIIGSGLVFLTCLAIMSSLSFQGEIYHYLLFGLLALLFGLTAFFVKDYSMIVWTSIFGSILTTLSLGLLFFKHSKSLNLKSIETLYEGIEVFVRENFVSLSIAFGVLLLLGLFVQFVFTCRSQLFIKRVYVGKHRKT